MANKVIHILMADDDEDDRFFFTKALKKVTVPTQLKTVTDGEALINHLSEGQKNIPDVLFLDINMPRKNGLECLTEIKADKRIKTFPVVIYSTSLTEDVADIFYQKGAHYYIRKCDLPELIRHLQFVLTQMVNEKFERVTRDKFVLGLLEV